MIDLYLKFETQQQADDLLFDVVENPDILDEDGNPVIESVPRWRNVDVIGIIYDKQQQPIDGWHVNVRLVDDEDQTQLEPHMITAPAMPSRVWA